MDDDTHSRRRSRGGGKVPAVEPKKSEWSLSALKLPIKAGNSAPFYVANPIEQQQEQA